MEQDDLFAGFETRTKGKEKELYVWSLKEQEKVFRLKYTTAY